MQKLKKAKYTLSSGCNEQIHNFQQDNNVKPQVSKYNYKATYAAENL